MKKTVNLRTMAVAIMSLLTFSVSALTAPIGSEIIDLGTLDGSSSYAFAVNNLGQVAGNSGNYAFFWDRQKGMVSLGTLSGGYSKGYGINDECQIVGNSGSATTGWRAFIWDSINGMRAVGAHGAEDINNKGQVVGGASAYIWDQIHGITFLGISDSYAYGVNNNGQVVGRYDGYTAFFWDPNDGMTPLGALGGYDGQAMSINDAGDVVGWADIANGNAHAFIWNKDEAMTDLGTLGGLLSEAYGVNNSGEVVGWSHTFDGSHAFYWSQTTGMIDLNLLLDENSQWSYLTNATAINDNGQIVGQGITNTGQTHAFLMTVIYGEPTLTGLEIVGPEQVARDSSVQYEAIAHYIDNSTKDVTTSAIWSILSGDNVTIDNTGLLVTQGYDTSEGITIHAQYTQGDIVVDDEKVIPSAEGLTFQGLGFLPGGGPDSYAYGVSANGRVVVGKSTSATMSQEAFYWTAEEGMTGLGDLPGGGNSSFAQAVSANGSVIVGGSSGEFPNGGNDQMPFKWTLSGGMVSLGGLSDYWGGLASSVSDDGTVIVGHGYVEGEGRAFRWTETDGMVTLGTLIGAFGTSEAYGVSADGKIVVGNSNSVTPDYYERKAFIWSAPHGMTELGTLPNGTGSNYANAVSADGSVVVGYSWSTNSREAYYWTAEEGMMPLGQLPDGTFARYSEDVSDDGSIIVGETSRSKAFIWDKDNGARLLQELLENEYGLELTGWKLESATGISDDGQTIVGYGINPHGDTEAWIVYPRINLGNLVGLEITGPDEVQERSVTSYKAVACYDSGVKRCVNNSATFFLESDIYATIDNDGLLYAKEIETPQDIVIHSTCNIDGVVYEAEKTVTVTCYVPIYVPDDYKTIKEAIFNAKDGEIIVVRDGLYNGQGNCNLEFGGRAITIRSENGPQNCIIDCEDTPRAFTFDCQEGPDSILEGFTMTRASGSAIYCSSSTGTSWSEPTIRNCIFTDNSAEIGSAIYNRSGTGDAVTSPTITNCIFIGNYGSTIYNYSGTGDAVTSPIITNCTFIDNLGPAIDGRQNISSGRTEAIITSCIFWGNSNEQISGDPDIAIVSYSCIQSGYQGIGNIDVDPLFADGANGDYHLRSERGRYRATTNEWLLDDVTSPCVDGGDPTIEPSNERMPNGGRINMGAYGNTFSASMSEWRMKADFNRNGIVDFEDFAYFAESWVEMEEWKK